MAATTTAYPRRASTERRRESIESEVSSSVNSRISDDELNAVTNVSTRRLLENMDDVQIEKAMEGLKIVQEKRRSSSSIKRGSGSGSGSGRLSSNESAAKAVHEKNGRRSSKTSSKGRKGGNNPKNVLCNDAGDAREFNHDAIPTLPCGNQKGGIPDVGKLSDQICKSTPDDGRRRMSKSLGYDAMQDHDYSQYVNDSDSDEGDNNTSPKAAKYDDRKEEVVASRKESFKKMGRGLGKLREEDEEEKSDAEDFDDGGEVAKKQFVGQSTPTPPRRVATRRRQSVGPGTSNSKWKPLSGPSPPQKVEEEKEEANETVEGETGTGVVGGLWNKFTKSVSGGSTPSLLSVGSSNSLEPKKIDGAKYFRRGKRRADKCQFLEAVALFNFALVRQREELGKNHINCGRTLNEIGLCWMMLGERYPAMTAFEEALYILQKRLGDGAEEVAEVTNNIWMVLHEQREETLMEIVSI